VSPKKGTFYARTLLPIDIRLYDAVELQGLDLTLQFDPKYMRVALDEQGNPRHKLTTYFREIGRWKYALKQPTGKAKKLVSREGTYRLVLEPLDGGKKGLTGSCCIVMVRFLPMGSTMENPDEKRGRRKLTPMKVVRCSAVDAMGRKLQVIVENGAYSLMANKPRMARKRPNLGAKGWRKDQAHRADRDIQILRYVHEMKFLTRDLIRKLWFRTKQKPKGSAGMAYKRVQNLVHWGYIERYNNPKTNYAKPYLLGDEGWKYLQREDLDFGLKRKDSLNSLQIEHDSEITEVRHHFEEAAKAQIRNGEELLLREWLSERRVRRQWQSGADDVDESRRFFAPDGIMIWGPRKAKVAFELERQIKDYKRCRIILRKYHDLITDGLVDWILLVVEHEKDRKRLFDYTFPGLLRTETEMPPLDYFKVAILGDLLGPAPFEAEVRWAFPTLTESPVLSKKGNPLKGVPLRIELEHVQDEPLFAIYDFRSWRGTQVTERHAQEQRRRDFEVLYAPKELEDWAVVDEAMEGVEPQSDLQFLLKQDRVISIKVGTRITIHTERPKAHEVIEDGETVTYYLHDIEPHDGEFAWERGWAETKFIRRAPMSEDEFEIVKPKDW